MNGHMTSREIGDWMAGSRAAELERHLMECGACRTELSKLEAAVGEFRASARELAERSAPVPLARAAWAKEPVWAKWVRFQYVGPAVAAACLALMMVWTPWGETPAPASQSATSDSALLSQVNTELSRSVPSPMEPLTKLVTWEGDSK